MCLYKRESFLLLLFVRIVWMPLCVSYGTRMLHFTVNLKTSGVYYPSFVVNNRSRIASIPLCAALSLADNGISFSYSKTTKTCQTYSKRILKTDNGVPIEGLTMYDRHVTQVSSCADVEISGVYTLEIDGVPRNVSCQAGESGSNGWTIIQRRINGITDFARPWDDYKSGFGDVYGEFWLGNELIHRLTSNQEQELRVEVETLSGKKYHALYNVFYIDDEPNGYKLHVSGYSGTAGDSLAYHNGAVFSTNERDNDNNPTINCASYTSGGWWFFQASKLCLESLLNGDYGQYFLWYGVSESTTLKTSKMMIRKRL